MNFEERLKKLMGEEKHPEILIERNQSRKNLQFTLDLSSVGDFLNEDLDNEINKLL
jgi:hypothetical protein